MYEDTKTLKEAIASAESGGDYEASNPNSSASGKYQFLRSTGNALATRLGESPDSWQINPTDSEEEKERKKNLQEKMMDLQIEDIRTWAERNKLHKVPLAKAAAAYHLGGPTGGIRLAMGEGLPEGQAEINLPAQEYLRRVEEAARKEGAIQGLMRTKATEDNLLAGIDVPEFEKKLAKSTPPQTSLRQGMTTGPKEEPGLWDRVKNFFTSESETPPMLRGSGIGTEEKKVLTRTPENAIVDNRAAGAATEGQQEAGKPARGGDTVKKDQTPDRPITSLDTESDLVDAAEAMKADAKYAEDVLKTLGMEKPTTSDSSFTEQIAKARTVLEEANKRSAWTQVAETISHAIARIMAARYGLKHGVDMSGLKFDKTDWDAIRAQNEADFKRAYSMISDERDRDSRYREDWQNKALALARQHRVDLMKTRLAELKAKTPKSILTPKDYERQKQSIDRVQAKLEKDPKWWGLFSNKIAIDNKEEAKKELQSVTPYLHLIGPDNSVISGPKAYDIFMDRMENSDDSYAEFQKMLDESKRVISTLQRQAMKSTPTSSASDTADELEE